MLVNFSIWICIGNSGEVYQLGSFSLGLFDLSFYGGFPNRLTFVRGVRALILRIYLLVSRGKYYLSWDSWATYDQVALFIKENLLL